MRRKKNANTKKKIIRQFVEEKKRKTFWMRTTDGNCIYKRWIHRKYISNSYWSIKCNWPIKKQLQLNQFHYLCNFALKIQYWIQSFVLQITSFEWKEKKLNQKETIPICTWTVAMLIIINSQSFINRSWWPLFSEQ